MGKILDVSHLYEKLKIKIRDNLPLSQRLTLASIKIESNDYASQMYIRQQAKLAQELKIDYRLISLEAKASSDEILQRIEALNKDNTVQGIVVNKPFPKNWNEELIFSALSVDKDIEGMNPCNLGKLFLGTPRFIPPTVLSVLEFIKDTGVKLYGKKVTLVGFSNIIGKPLSLLLGDKFATVSITHIATYEAGDLRSYISDADILISATGVPGLIKGSWIKKGAVVVDVGVGEKDGKLTGDVEFEAAKKKASFITPVPGGVGKLTTMFLFHNLIIAAKI